MKHLLMIVFCIMLLAVLGAAEEQNLLGDLQKARQDKNLIKQTTVLIHLGDLYVAKHDYPAAVRYYVEAYEVAMLRKNAEDQAFTAVQIGNCLDHTGELDEALKWYNIALVTAQTPAAKGYLSKIHNNMGNIYLKIGSFSKSLDHYQKALEIKKAAKDNPGIANALMNMSVFYLKTGDTQRSLDYQMQALELRRQTSDRDAIASNLNSISVSYRNLKDYPKAFEYNRQALDMYTALGNTAKIASTYNNLGVLYLHTGEIQRAKQTYLKSYELKKDSQDLESILSSLANLADICLRLGQLNETKRYLALANSILKQAQFYELSRTIYSLNAQYNERTGNYKAALKYYKQFHTISDSLANEQKIIQLSEMEVKYGVLEKEKNIELLTRNNELSQRDLKKSAQLRNYLMIIIILILVISIVMIWRYLSILRLSKSILASKEKLNELNRELEIRVETEVEHRRQQEQKALRQSRLAILGELAAGIAHEMNQPMQTLSLTLENIKLAIQDNEISGEYLERKLRYLFADITRMQEVIEHIRCFSRQSDDLSPEVFDINQSIMNAVTMVKDRFEQSGVSFSIDIGSGIPPQNGNQYKFEHVILNLLTNARDAILESMETSRLSNGQISISSKVQDKQICITVEDNGCGIPEELKDKVFDIFFTTKSLDKGTGLGLSISAGIIQGMDATISLDSQPGAGTQVSILIPITKTAKQQ